MSFLILAKALPITINLSSITLCEKWEKIKVERQAINVSNWLVGKNFRNTRIDPIPMGM